MAVNWNAVAVLTAIACLCLILGVVIVLACWQGHVCDGCRQRAEGSESPPRGVAGQSVAMQVSPVCTVTKLNSQPVTDLAESQRLTQDGRQCLLMPTQVSQLAESI